jgi:hypothetical protein
MMTPRGRSFAAVIDQDGLALIEYRQDKTGFRVVGSRSDFRRFDSAVAASEALVALLEAERAKRAKLCIAIHGFGTFHHTMVLPTASDDVIRPIVEREVRRVFNTADPHVAISRGPPVERRDAPRTEGGADQLPRQILVAGAPRSIVADVRGVLEGAGVSIEILTVIPETLRRVFDALDGSSTTTAMVVCLAGGPHLAFFVAGRLELALEPPIALEGVGAVDPASIVEQFERGVLFLRQQARGATPTRVLLAALPSDFDAIAGALASRFGVRVDPLARSLGSPEEAIAMGAVLESETPTPLDLIDHPPHLGARIRSAVRGPWRFAVPAAGIAAVALVWGGIQFGGLFAKRREIEDLRGQVQQGLPALEQIREAVQERALIAQLRETTGMSHGERRRLAAILARLASAAPGTVHFDSLSIVRMSDGWRGSVQGTASATTGAEAVRGITGFIRSVQGARDFEKVDWQIVSWSGVRGLSGNGSIGPQPGVQPIGGGGSVVKASFVLTFVAQPSLAGGG